MPKQQVDQLIAQTPLDRLGELATLLSIRSGSKMLDVGCGLGSSARYLASVHGCSVTGSDLNGYSSICEQIISIVVRFNKTAAGKLQALSGTVEVTWDDYASAVQAWSL